MIDDGAFAPKTEAASLDQSFASIDHFFADGGTHAQGSHQSMKLQTSEAPLLENISDSGLTIDVICAANGVSPRTLSRLFRAENTSPMR